MAGVTAHSGNFQSSKSKMRLQPMDLRRRSQALRDQVSRDREWMYLISVGETDEIDDVLAALPGWVSQSTLDIHDDVIVGVSKEPNTPPPLHYQGASMRSRKRVIKPSESDTQEVSVRLKCYEKTPLDADDTVDVRHPSIRVCVISSMPREEVGTTRSSLGNRHCTPRLFTLVALSGEHDERPGDVCSTTTAPQKPLLKKSRYASQDSPQVFLYDWERGHEAQGVPLLKLGQSTHDLEIDLIKKILDAAPELQKHLPHIFINLYNSESNLHLPRFNLNTQSDNNLMEIYELKVIVAERCYELWMVNSLEEFKTAFLDILECHNRAYVKGNALHGEVVARNAMFYRHKTYGVVGCLNGFSNSSASAGGGSSGSKASRPFRTGAVPFMALDIIDDTKAPMPRFYRHDLESFVYLLVWAGVHFDIRRHTHEVTNKFLASWEAHTPSEFIQAHDNKTQFWINDNRAESIRSQFQEAFIPLWNEWIMPLRELFYNAWKADCTHRRQIRRGQVSELDIETVGGILTFETFMKALGKQPRHWDTE
ncbi:hypothetical protein EV421DRAFT_583819 [Armillaria borealis]|uniref:Fungal-type protein kinase domain-containing protein n=1 Tax=Armillaria borealis TaxID=47425 RepID=A0AA39MQC9_9AGAR|nr:hypothetical protein EV421DRAFT_583819 [Armillaria borealis]